MIRKLQEEDEAALEERRRQREAEEQDQFLCKICLSGFDEEDSELGEESKIEIMPLSLCEHIFHQSCLTSYLKSRIEESKFPLLCPDLECKVEIGDLDLKELLPDAEYGKFAAFTLNSAVAAQKDLSWCPTADCKFAFVYDPSEEVKRNDDAQGLDGHQLKCPLCKKHYCLRCKVLYHEGVSCKDF